MLRVVDLCKSYLPGRPVLNHVSLEVAAGEIVALLGPSGCGKSTLLRLIAGLETAEDGEIWVADENLAGVSVHLRRFGLMFQDFALFPHRTVGENIAFGLRMQGATKAAIAQRVAQMLDLVNLTGYERRSVFALSGGERQRVALARSLAPSPRLLMLDEPLGSLDRVLREGLMVELRQILKHMGMTTLYVTHDQQEALAIADRVAVMSHGRIEQSGTPQELFLRPANRFVAHFMGLTNLLPATVMAEAPKQAITALGRLDLPAPAPAGSHVLLIRPKELRLLSASAASLPVAKAEQHTAGKTPLRGVVDLVSFRGDFLYLSLRVESAAGMTPLEFHAPINTPLQPGQEIDFWIEPDSCQLLSG
jgi:ABC-type Fe3+/spermidine/putrescine transport system ATPase subunit